jgi:hypothetical protein
MSSPTKTQLLGGAFQDSEGNVLELGYLTFRLNQDSEVAGLQICSGIEITIQLDTAGNVASSSSTPPAIDQYIWATDVLNPVNAYYTVTGYTAEGQPAWGPNNQQISSGGVGGGTFNLSSWIPNQVISWTPSLQSGTAVQINGVPLSSTTLANFENSGTVTFTDEGGGVIEASAPTPNCLPQPDAAQFASWTAALPGLGEYNLIAPTFNDSISFGYPSYPIPYSTAPTASSPAFITTLAGIWFGLLWINLGRDANFKTRLSLTAPGNSTVYWGLCSENYIDPTQEGGNILAITYQNSGNFQLVSCIDGVSTYFDTGIAPTVGQWYAVWIKVRSGVATLFVDDVPVATASVLPAANLALCWCTKQGLGSTLTSSMAYMYADNATL